MPRLAALFLLISVGAIAGLLPEGFEGATRTSNRKPDIPDAGIWKECGYQDSDFAEYKKAGKSFSITAWRFTDTTASLEAFEFLVPADAQVSDLTKVSAKRGTVTWAIYGNYLLIFDNFTPSDDEILAQLMLSLPRLDQAPFPSLKGALPQNGKIPRTERYILGPAGMAKFVPQISPSLAAFSMGAEGRTARYKAAEGEMRLTLLSYPTPHIARDRLAEFQKLEGIRVKRSGPILGIVTDFTNADAAEKLLADVRYEPNITVNVKGDTYEPQIGEIVVTGVKFACMLFLFSLLAAFGLKGVRLLISRMRGEKPGEQEEEMTLLRLGGGQNKS